MYAFKLLINFLSHFIQAFIFRKDFRTIPEIVSCVFRQTHYQSQVYDKIDHYRTKLYSNKIFINEANPGAGSRSHRKSIGQMAALTSVNKKYGRLLYNLASCRKPDMIIELGTAFGLSTMYLSAGNPDARIITVEGNSQVAAFTCEIFRERNLENITLINKPFHEVVNHLSTLVSDNTLVFIDGNHTFDATVSYFDTFLHADCLVFDDINWSDGMMKAWKKIKSSPAAGTVIDLFWMGIVFPHGQRQNLRLWY